MASINDIADRLCEVISSVTGLPCTQIVDQPQAPCVMVYPDTIGGDTYYEAFRRGVVTVPMVCSVLVPSGELSGMQRLLNDAVSPFGNLSIPEAIHLNPTLGTADDEATASSSAAMSAKTAGMPEYGFVDSPSGRLLQAKLRIEVMTRGDR